MSSTTPTLTLHVAMDQITVAPDLGHIETMDYPGMTYYILCSAYLIVVTTVGLSLNSAFLVCYLTQSRMRTAIGTLYLNLCIADLLISLSSLVKAVHVATGTRMEEGELMCAMFGFLTFIGGMESLFSLMAIALYRYSVVTRRINSKSVSLWQSFTILIVLWVVGLVLASGPLFGWNQYVPDQPNNWCALKWNDRSNTGISYLAVTFSVVFIIPVGTMTFSYTSIWIALKKISNLLGRTTGSQSHKAEKVLARSSFLMAACFLLSWLPYSLLAMAIFIGIAPPALPYYVAVIPPMMCKASPCLNPIVYLATDPEIRKILRKWRECCHPTTEPDNEKKLQLEGTTTLNHTSSCDKQPGQNDGLDGCGHTTIEHSRRPAYESISEEAKKQREVGNDYTDSLQPLRAV